MLLPSISNGLQDSLLKLRARNSQGNKTVTLSWQRKYEHDKKGDP